MAKCDGKGKYKTVVIGDYVFTPIKNQFNAETAYWLSKKFYAIAIYCFTICSNNDLRILDDTKILDSYIEYFDKKINSSKLA